MEALQTQVVSAENASGEHDKKKVKKVPHVHTSQKRGGKTMRKSEK